MAVRLAGSSSNYLSRAHTWGTTGTVAFWYLRNSTSSPYSTILDLGGTNQILYDWDGTDKLSYYDNGSDFQGSALGTNTWHHIAVVRASATSGTVYLNGASDFTMTSVGAWGTLRIGSNVTWGEPGNMTIFAFKAWDAALTLAEIQQERYTILPVRYANLWLFSPMFDGASERLADYSGNGNTWSQTGTLSDVAPGPVSWGGKVWVYPFAAAAGGVTVTPATADSATAAVAPTVVLGSVSVTPATADSITVAVAPTVVQGSVSVTPATADSATTAIAPTVVLGSVAVTPVTADSATVAIAPTVVLGSLAITPATADSAATAIDPTVNVSGGGVAVTPATADSATVAIAPTVVLGSLAITPVVASSAATAIAPYVIAGLVQVLVTLTSSRSFTLTAKREFTLTSERDFSITYRGNDG